MSIKIERLKALKKRREEFNVARDEFQELETKFLQEHSTLIKRKNELKECIEMIEGDVKKLIIYDYDQTGEKKQDYGMSIQVREVFEFDKQIAFNWALDHKMALKLDETAFKKQAKAQNIDFVTYSEKVIATIPKEIKLEEGA